MIVKSCNSMQSADRPRVELEVACDVLESAESGKMYGFYVVTSNFELNVAAFEFSKSFF